MEFSEASVVVLVFVTYAEVVLQELCYRKNKKDKAWSILVNKILMEDMQKSDIKKNSNNTYNISIMVIKYNKILRLFYL